MLDTCNTLGVIVTIGGTGALLGVSLAAWLFGSRAEPHPAPLDARPYALALEMIRGRSELALDDLHGLPSSIDVANARRGLRFAIEELEALERRARGEAS